MYATVPRMTPSLVTAGDVIVGELPLMRDVRSPALPVRSLRQPEVEHLDATGLLAFAEHDVRRLEIAVRDAFWCAAAMASAIAMPMVSTRSSGRPPGGSASASDRPLTSSIVRKSGRVGVLHRMDGDDVRVVQGGDGLRFALESLAALGVGGRDVRQNLERHLALQPRIARAIDFAHAAGAEQRHDLVGTEPCSRAERHRARFCHGMFARRGFSVGQVTRRTWVPAGVSSMRRSFVVGPPTAIVSPSERQAFFTSLPRVGPSVLSIGAALAVAV